MLDERTPMVPDNGQTTVQIKAADDQGGVKGHRPIRVIAWDVGRFPLTVGPDGRLVRAQERDDFLSVTTRKHASEREVDVAAAPGWLVRIVELGPNWDQNKMDWNVQVGDEYPVILWRYLGPTDVRPVIPRPARNAHGDAVTQRGYDPIEMKMVVHLLGPGEAWPAGR
jgi:hypothetical protein